MTLESRLRATKIRTWTKIWTERSGTRMNGLWMVKTMRTRDRTENSLSNDNFSGFVGLRTLRCKHTNLSVQ